MTFALGNNINRHQINWTCIYCLLLTTNEYFLLFSSFDKLTNVSQNTLHPKKLLCVFHCPQCQNSASRLSTQLFKNYGNEDKYVHELLIRPRKKHIIIWQAQTNQWKGAAEIWKICRDAFIARIISLTRNLNLSNFFKTPYSREIGGKSLDWL